MQDVLVLEPVLPTGWRYAEGDTLVAVAFSRYAGTWGPFDVEPEIGLARRLGRQSVTEVWAAFYLRYYLPWDGFLRTSLAVSTGVNLASRYSEVEIERTSETSGYKLMHFFSPEITIALPSRPEVELLLRFHHRSGAFGLINDAGGGAQYGTVGLRFRF